MMARMGLLRGIRPTDIQNKSVRMMVALVVWLVICCSLQVELLGGCYGYCSDTHSVTRSFVLRSENRDSYIPSQSLDIGLVFLLVPVAVHAAAAAAAEEECSDLDEIAMHRIKTINTRTMRCLVLLTVD